MQAIPIQAHARRLPRMLLPALAALAVLAAPGVARAAAPLSWSGAASTGLTVTGPISLSCPSSGLCVAVDGEGDALVSSTPLSASPSWQAVAVAPGHALTGISCPSSGLCVAVDGEGDAFVSTHPTSTSPGTWQPVEIDKGKHLAGISCPSTSLCLAIDGEGGARISTDPTSTSSAAWQPVEVAEAHHLTGISCLSTMLCVAVDAEGYALASSLLGPTWSATKIDAGALDAVSCSASGLCVAVDAAGHSLASDEPAGTAPHWDAATVQSAAGGLSAVSCMPDGRCLAAGPAAGTGALTVYAGSVPPPTVATGAAGAVGQTEATLSGSVDPADAVLSACQFEYGTSTSYGHQAPCAAMPASTDASQPVGAAIAGLTPDTTYHFRLSASNGAGAAVGADQTFRTGPPPPAPPPQLVYPRPYISGTPAVGSSLTCQPNLPAGGQATLSYTWLRGLVVIPGAISDVYTVKGTDTGHHLQCRVTATDAAGSATRTSGFVAVPVQGVLAAVGETEVAHASVKRTRVEVAVSCSKQAPKGCAIVAQLTVQERLRGKRIVAVSAGAPPWRGRSRIASARRAGGNAHAAARRTGRQAKLVHAPRERTVTVTIGVAEAHLRPGHDRVVKIHLNHEGVQLLRSQRHGLKAHLLVTGTVVGVITATLRRETVAIPAPARTSRRHRAHRSSAASRRAGRGRANRAGAGRRP